MTEIYNITPVPKPRMTRRDKWAKRKCVVEYFAYKDLLRKEKIELPVEKGFIVTFCLPMPKSWSKKKRKEMNGKPHTQKPDIDNLLKGLLDAVLDEDSHIWNVWAMKLWGDKGNIVITFL